MCCWARPVMIASTEDQSQALPGLGAQGPGVGWIAAQLIRVRSVPILPVPIFWKSRAVGGLVSTTPQNVRGVFAGAGVAAMPQATSSANSGIIASEWRARQARGVLR